MELDSHSLRVVAMLLVVLNIGSYLGRHHTTNTAAAVHSKRGTSQKHEREPVRLEQTELLATPGGWTAEVVFWVSPNRYALLVEAGQGGVSRPSCDPQDTEIAFRPQILPKGHYGRKAVLVICNRKSSDKGALGQHSNQWEKTLDRRKAHPPPYASVCHPYIQDSDKKVRQYWADYYLARGFEKVVFYIKSADQAYEAPGVVNVVAQFLQYDKTPYFGQIWAMTHCLYTNK